MDDIYFSGNRTTANPQGTLPPPTSPAPAQKKRKKKHGFIKALISLLLIFVIVFVAGSGYVYNLMSKTDYNEAGHKNNVYVDSVDLLQDPKVHNILFIGVDRREEDISSRSDSMILFSIDKNNKKIKLTSFMRDTWVDIPGRRYAKLNASCTWGGAQLLMDTIEYNFNIKIDNYVLVDFDSFVDIVNKLGGVSVEITEKEAKYLRDDVHLKIEAGENVPLNGNEALWYSRIRFLDSDFMRTYRQRKVMTAIVEQARQTNILKLIGIVKDILPDVETDLNPLELTKLAIGSALVYIRYEVAQARVPADDTWKNATINGQAVLQADIGKNQEMLKEFLYGKDEENSSLNEETN